MAKYFLIFIGILLFFSATAYAQCGAEGLDRCCGNPAKACKAGGKPTSVSAKLNASTDAIIKQRTELVRLQRQSAERLRKRQKQLARTADSETAKLIKSLIEYDRKGKKLSLFPVEGFTPGVKQTTYFSLLLDTQECSQIEETDDSAKCYINNGYHFYFDKNNVSDHLYVNRFRIGGMPDTWTQYGFDWDLSYNGWTSLFKKLGYQTLVTQKPKIEKRGDSKFFDAEMMAIVKTPQGRMQITLDFTNGFGKTKANDSGTLFSMIVDKID